MEDRIDNFDADKSCAQQDGKPIEQNSNILEELKGLNQKMENPNYRPYKKSTYWHEQSTTIDEVKQDAQQKELMECLLRIEAKLAKIENLLEKKKFRFW